MNFSSVIDNSKYQVILQGRTTATDCQQVIEIARKFKDSDCNILEFDFSKLVLLDSLGLSIIMLVKNELNNANGKKFVLKHPTGKVKHMFKSFNIDKIVEIDW